MLDLWDSTKRDEKTALPKIQQALQSRLEGFRPVVGPQLDMEIVPRSLGAALWLLFWREIRGMVDLLRCRQCGEWFKYRKASTKTPRLFCSQACRSKAYRDKQETARRLRRKGLPIGRIAKRLGSTPETVEGWTLGEPYTPRPAK